MRVINAVNVNDAWASAKSLLNARHVVRPSRVGEVWEYPTPVTTVYSSPLQRVLFDPARNANPFFHLMEALHLLAGRRDVAWLERFNSQIRKFVGPDDDQYGAYGYRLRYAFDMDGGGEDGEADQIQKVIRMLKKSPDERRAVLANWDAQWDLERPDKADIPCNTHVYCKIRDGSLDITVCCRSNDIMYGCYGSNCVQFSILQEYLAAMIGVPVGVYYQVSDSFHAYTERWDKHGGLEDTPVIDFYGDAPDGNNAQPYPLVAYPEVFDAELQRWMDRDFEYDTTAAYHWSNPFFYEVAEPMWQAWDEYKAGNLQYARGHLYNCVAMDWRIAAMAWINRVARRRSERAGEKEKEAV